MNIIRILAVPGQVVVLHESAAPGDYIVSIDPDAHEGMGETLSSPERKYAKRFENAVDAFNYWRQQSSVRPIREDGMPNRPGTAFTVEILEYVGV